MKLQKSGEDYLETILILKHRNGFVRSIDIAKAMSFSKPSVSRAVSLLKGAGHITVNDDGSIELTQTGLKIAETIYTRHLLLTEWLTAIGVSPETAAEDACKMEHVISQETFLKIRNHIKPQK